MVLFLLLGSLFSGCGGKIENEKVSDTVPVQQSVPTEKDAVIPTDQLAAKGKSVDGLSYDYIISLSDGSKVTQKVWVEDGKMRSQMSNPGGGDPMISIANLSVGEVYFYQPELKQAMKMPIANSEIDTTSPKDYLEKLDSANTMFMKRETFDGKECLVYEINVDGTSSKIWIWEEYGMPLRLETQNGGDKMVTEFLNFKIGDIDDALFKLPEGTKIIKLASMGI